MTILIQGAATAGDKHLPSSAVLQIEACFEQVTSVIKLNFFISLNTIPKGFPYGKTNNGFTAFLLATDHCVSAIPFSHNALQGRRCQMHRDNAQWCLVDVKSASVLVSAMDN